jgi:hypothetical protein
MISPLGSPTIKPNEARQGHHFGHEGGAHETMPVGELAESLRHLLGMKEGAKVMINFAVSGL